VIHSDLLPHAKWRWFLLEDVGNHHLKETSVDLAIEAAFQFGELQNTVRSDPTLSNILPCCLPSQLQKTVLDVCEWAIATSEPQLQAPYFSFQTKIASANSFFQDTAKKLVCLPPTCVHGDADTCNIIISDNRIHFIDWGDALWGVGSVSIVKLIVSLNNLSMSNVSEIWSAYFRGWKRDI
jgi:hypothetical protein